jgi:hypothetical protein
MSKRTTSKLDVFGPRDYITEDRLLCVGWDPGEMYGNGSLDRPVLYDGQVIFRVMAELRVPRLYRSI